MNVFPPPNLPCGITLNRWTGADGISGVEGEALTTADFTGAACSVRYKCVSLLFDCELPDRERQGTVGWFLLKLS